MLVEARRLTRVAVGRSPSTSSAWSSRRSPKSFRLRVARVQPERDRAVVRHRLTRARQLVAAADQGRSRRACDRGVGHAEVRGRGHRRARGDRGRRGRSGAHDVRELVRIGAGTRCRGVVRVARVARDPPVGAGGGRRERSRDVGSVSGDRDGVREHSARRAGRIGRPVEVEGDRPGQARAAGESRAVRARAAEDPDARRGLGRDRRRGLGNDDGLVRIPARARNGIIVVVTAVARYPAVRTGRRGREWAGRCAAAADRAGQRRGRGAQAGRGHCGSVEPERDGSRRTRSANERRRVRNRRGSKRDARRSLSRDARGRLPDRDGFIRVVARAADGGVVRIAREARDPTIGACGRRLGRRRGGRTGRDGDRRGRDDRAGAVDVVGTVEREGDGAGRAGTAGKRRGICDRASDRHARRGLGGDRQRSLFRRRPTRSSRRSYRTRSRCSNRRHSSRPSDRYPLRWA